MIKVISIPANNVGAQRSADDMWNQKLAEDDDVRRNWWR
jgi:hypothetical protein